MREEHRLILEEEFNTRRAEDTEQVDVIDEGETPFFLEQRNFTTSATFTPRRGDTDQDSLPIEGIGRLDNYLIVANTDSFDVELVIDDREVVNDTYATLSALSNELEHVSAYERRDEYVVVIREYPFKESVHTTIRPRGEVEFTRVRVEGVLEDEPR